MYSNILCSNSTFFTLLLVTIVYLVFKQYFLHFCYQLPQYISCVQIVISSLLLLVTIVYILCSHSTFFTLLSLLDDVIPPAALATQPVINTQAQAGFADFSQTFDFELIESDVVMYILCSNSTFFTLLTSYHSIYLVFTQYFLHVVIPSFDVRTFSSSCHTTRRQYTSTRWIHPSTGWLC